MFNPCGTPGMKIRSKGLGRGLAFGQGRGPLGNPSNPIQNQCGTGIGPGGTNTCFTPGQRLGVGRRAGTGRGFFNRREE